MTRLFGISLAAAALSLVSCSNIRISSARKIDSADRTGVKRILVLATAGVDDTGFGAEIEKRCAQDLCYLGYDAIAGSDSYKTADFAADKEAETMQRMTRDSIDAIMAVSLLNWDVEKKEMPEDLWCSPYNNYNRLFWCYQTQVLRKTGAAGYYGTRSRYIWEFNFYSAGDQCLIYCARTNAKPMGKAQKDGPEYCDLILADMAWRGVLQIGR